MISKVCELRSTNKKAEFIYFYYPYTCAFVFPEKIDSLRTLYTVYSTVGYYYHLHWR